jgi:DNA polymerase-1
MLLSFDVETHAMSPIVAPPLVVGAWSDGLSAWLTNRTDTVDAFREALRQDEIVGCNIVFDLGVMCVAEPRLVPHVFQAVEENRVYSVDLSEALHDIARGCLYKDPETGEPFQRYSLVRLEQRYLGIDRTEQKKNGWRLRYGELADVPLAQWPTEAIEYPKADALNTYRVHMAQAQHDNSQARGEEMRAAWSRHLQRAWGIRTDPERVAALREAVTKTHEETVAKFTACGLYRGEGQINPASKTGRPYPRSQYGTKNTALLKERVTAAYRGSPPLTAGGEVSCDRDTMLESGDELLEEFAATGENEKLFSTYLELLEVGTKRPIHPDYRLVVTGRPSSSNPNLYNLPRDHRIRECVIPRDGFLFADGDYAAIEFATLAQETYELFGYSELRDALLDGKDPHLLFAANLMSALYAETVSRYEHGDKQVKGLRQLGKAYNYGKGGGMGGPKMVHTSRKQGVRFCVASGERPDCTGERVTEYRGRPIKPACVDCLRVGERADSAYFTTWSVMEHYFKLVSQETAGGSGSIKGYGFTRGGCTFTNGANFRFQHRASRGQNRALWRLARECYVDRSSPLFGSRPVVTPYDQALTEVPEARAPEAADRQALIMREEMQAVCPDVPIKVEPVLTRRWMKDAKPKRDASGRLMVTEC